MPRFAPALDALPCPSARRPPPGRAQLIFADAVFQRRWRCAALDEKIAGGAVIMDNTTSIPEPQRAAERRAPRTLAVDIGGTGIKAELLDEHGRPLTERARIATPKKATPRKVIAVVRKLARTCGAFDRVSVGFPGVIKNGVVYTAPNLGSGWNDFDLQRELGRALKRPVRIANDADVQGLGAISGRGVELVITLGTGFGSVIFVDGHRIHLELAHHPFRKGKTYEDELGHRALKKKGKARWNRRLREAIDDLKQIFNYDRLFIGGGNARYIRFDLPADVKVISNEEGLLGGIKLWQEPERKGTFRRRAAALSPEKRPASTRAVTTGKVSAGVGPAVVKPALAAIKASPAGSKSATAARKRAAPATKATAATAKRAAAATMPAAAVAKAAVAAARLGAAAAKIAAAEAAAMASKAKMAARAERQLAGADGPASARSADTPGETAAANLPSKAPDPPGSLGAANEGR
jgi:polyphosphate glucokinase